MIVINNSKDNSTCEICGTWCDSVYVGHIKIPYENGLYITAHWFHGHESCIREELEIIEADILENTEDDQNEQS